MSCFDPSHSARVHSQACGNSACGLAVKDCGSGGLQTGWLTTVQPDNWDLSVSGHKASISAATAIPETEASASWLHGAPIDSPECEEHPLWQRYGRNNGQSL